MGTTPVYMLAAAAYRMTRPPLVVGGIAMLYGYFGSMLKRAPQYGNAEFRRFLRAYQWSCLLRGKMAATAELSARVEARWRPSSASPAPLIATRPLGEILVHTCALALEKLEEALAAQRGEYAGKRIGEILVDMKLVSQDQVLRALSVQHRVTAGAARHRGYLDATAQT
jgi:hypothetical protein